MRAAQTALRELAESDRALRAQHEAVERELQRIADLPEPLEDCVRNMRALLDASAAQVDAESAEQLVSHFSGEVVVERDGRIRIQPARGRFDVAPFGQLATRHLIWLATEAAKVTFERAIRAADVEGGLPLAERPAALRAAMERRRQIEDAHEALVETAAASGMVLQHLGPVAARREAAAAQLRREENIRAKRQELEARIEHRYGGPTRRRTPTQGTYLGVNTAHA